MDRGFSLVCRRLAVVAALLLSALPATGGIPLSAAREKADRFYRHEEWANALAMFRLILEEDPADMRTYGRSVAVYGAIGNAEEQILLLERTQSLGLPLDGLFDEVRKSAYEIDRPHILERFMLLVKERQPWLKRNINLRLARYYDSRNNAPKMIAMSDSLLSQNPNDPSMLRVKARGRMLQDDYEGAVAVYKRILELQPDDTDAMLNIGIYYYNDFSTNRLPLDSEAAEEARRYLSMAFRLRPTEHLRSLLSALSAE